MGKLISLLCVYSQGIEHDPCALEGCTCECHDTTESLRLFLDVVTQMRDELKDWEPFEGGAINPPIADALHFVAKHIEYYLADSKIAIGMANDLVDAEVNLMQKLAHHVTIGTINNLPDISELDFGPNKELF